MGLFKRTRSVGARAVDEAAGDEMMGPWLELQQAQERARLAEEIDRAMLGDPLAALLGAYDSLNALPFGTDEKRRQWVVVSLLARVFGDAFGPDELPQGDEIEQHFWTCVDRLSFELADGAVAAEASPFARALADSSFIGAAAVINTLIREPIVEVPALAHDLAYLANEEDRAGLAPALGAVAWYFAFHLIEEGQGRAEHVRSLVPAMCADNAIEAAISLDDLMALAVERERYVATAGADEGFESAFSNFVSRAIGVPAAVARGRAAADAGPLIDACNRFLDETLSEAEKSLEG